MLLSPTDEVNMAPLEKEVLAYQDLLNTDSGICLCAVFKTHLLFIQ